MAIWLVCEFFLSEKRNLIVRIFCNNETAYLQNVEIADGHFPLKLKTAYNIQAKTLIDRHSIELGIIL